MNATPSPATRWKDAFRLVTWLGIALNLCLSLPLIIVPTWMLELLRVGGAPVTWPQFFGVLLTILSGFYISAALDVDRYRGVAWGTIASRAAGVVFALVAVLVLGADEAFLAAVLLDGSIGLTQFVTLSVVELKEHGHQRRSVLASPFVLGGVLLASTIALVGWHKLFRAYPQQLADDSMESYFKHGSIGTEEEGGIPYWIWHVLPQVFPEHLPAAGGYESLGFLHEPGHDLPIGFSRRKIGYDRIGINCALCHTGAATTSDGVNPQIFPGAPGTTVNLLDYQRFLFRCAEDPRFTADNLMPAIDRQTRLSLVDQWLYSGLLIPGARKALIRQAERWAWAFEKDRPHWGRGRIEPFNPVKRNVLDVPVGTTLGTSDMQSLWQAGVPQGRGLHWDGLNTSLREVVQSGALGDGATPESIPLERLARLEEWLQTLPAPRWPYAPPDPDLVASGKEIYEVHSAVCHARDGRRMGDVTPASEVGTDPERAAMWTQEASEAYNAYLGNRSWRFTEFRATGGYLNVPLDGLWLRALYLHNGSVPTLRHLLSDPADRPQHFWRGATRYDVTDVGFEWDSDEAKRLNSLYNTRLRGNGNGGHVYGTTLKPREKDVLLEFLKTL